MKKVVLCGCGAVGAGYDLDQDGRVKRSGRVALSHAGALQGRDDAELLACIDRDLSIANKVANAFGVPHAYRTLSECSAAGIDADIVAIAASTESHATECANAIEMGARALLCEKPLADKTNQADEIIDLAERNGVLLAVNYQRLWNSSVIALSERVSAGEFGELQSAHGVYVKGVMHNAPHLVTLIQEFCGPLVLLGADHAGREHGARDADFILAAKNYPGVRIYVMALDHNKYDIFEATFYFEKAVIQFENAGKRIRLRIPAQHPDYPGYSCPEAETRLDLDTAGEIASVYDELISCLDDGKDLRRPARWCVEAERICATIRDA